MFFVSEEFLRKYAEGQDAVQTIAEAIPAGQGLFEEGTYQTKRGHHDAKKEG